VRLKDSEIHSICEVLNSSEELLHVRCLQMSIEGLEAIPLLNDCDMIVAHWLLNGDGTLNVDCRFILNAPDLGEDLWLHLVKLSQESVSLALLALLSGNNVNDILLVHLIYI
jgi:hypothetical protein